MTGIILLLGQLGVAAGGFIGMASVVTFYHKGKGGEKNGNNNNKSKQINNN